MIKSVTVETKDGDTLDMVLAEPELSGFAIIKIDGLGPEDAELNTTEITYGDGSIINSKRVKGKTIQFNIIYLWNATIEDSRNTLYNYFPLSKEVRLYFLTDSKFVYIDGVVQQHKPEIFEEQSGCSIVVECSDPFFKENTDLKSNLVGVDSGFIFPFANNSLTENLLTFGEIITTDSKTIVYQGTKETGFTIFGEFDTNADYFEIGCNGDLLIFNNLNALTGDQIVINTRNGQKQAILIRNNQSINIIGKIDILRSRWLYLKPGLNNLSFITRSYFKSLSIHTNILYRGI